MGVTVEIEVGEIRNRFGRAVGRHLACAHETSQTLSHFDVRQVWRMEIVPLSKETGLDPGAKRSLQEKFQQG